MIRYSDFCNFDIIDSSISFIYFYYKLPDGSCKDFYFKLDDVDIFYKERAIVVCTYLSSDPEHLREISYYFERCNIKLFIIHNGIKENDE